MASRTSLMLVAVTFIHLVPEKLKEFSQAKKVTSCQQEGTKPACGANFGSDNRLGVIHEKFSLFVVHIGYSRRLQPSKSPPAFSL